MKREGVEIMDFNRNDLSEFIGKRSALSFFIKLRRDELGYFKTIRYKPNEIRSIVFFNPDEIIAHYKHKMQKYISDPFLVARPLYMQSWEKAIKIAEHFKKR